MDRFSFSRTDYRIDPKSRKTEQNHDKIEAEEKQTTYPKKTRFSHYLESKKNQKKESQTEKNLENPQKKNVTSSIDPPNKFVKTSKYTSAYKSKQEGADNFQPSNENINEYKQNPLAYKRRSYNRNQKQNIVEDNNNENMNKRSSYGPNDNENKKEENNVKSFKRRFRRGNNNNNIDEDKKEKNDESDNTSNSFKLNISNKNVASYTKGRLVNDSSDKLTKVDNPIPDKNEENEINNFNDNNPINMLDQNDVKEIKEVTETNETIDNEANQSHSNTYKLRNKKNNKNNNDEKKEENKEKEIEEDNIENEMEDEIIKDNIKNENDDEKKEDNIENQNEDEIIKDNEDINNIDENKYNNIANIENNNINNYENENEKNANNNKINNKINNNKYKKENEYIIMDNTFNEVEQFNAKKILKGDLAEIYNDLIKTNLDFKDDIFFVNLNHFEKRIGDCDDKLISHNFKEFKKDELFKKYLSPQELLGKYIDRAKRIKDENDF